MGKARFWALVYEVDGEVKLAHRIKRVHSVYSSPTNHRPLVFDSLKKAEKALEKTSIGNYLPEGTGIVELREV